MRTIRAVAAVAALAILAGACGDDGGSAEAREAPSILRVGVPPGEADPALLDRFAPINDLIAEATGIEVDATLTTDYLAIVEAMRSGLLDIGFLGPFPVPIAQKVAGVVPLVAAEGAPYSSAIVCRTDRGIDSIDDVRDRKVAFVDPGSTSGNYIPRLLLTRAGIDPEQDISSIFAGGHDAAGLATQQGTVDCNGMAVGAYESMVKADVLDPELLRIVEESEPIPISLVMVARKGLHPGTVETIVEAFTSTSDAAVLEAAGGAKAFIPPAEDDFRLFREAAEELGLELEDFK